MDDPPRFECLTAASVNYSRVDCFDECFVEAAQNFCRCAVVGNFNRNKWPLCTTSQFSSCIFSYLKKQFEASKDSEHYFFGCRQRCKPRCTYWQYQSAISYSKFPSEEARTFAKDEDEWTRMKNTIIVDLYYEKLEFTRIKHYRAMTIHVSMTPNVTLRRRLTLMPIIFRGSSLIWVDSIRCGWEDRF